MPDRGRLFVVGLGPGSAETMTPQAREAVRRADVVVGYSGYFAWVADLISGQEVIALPLTQESERARVAAERASRGASVAVISSGDAGVYGMASLVFETLGEAGLLDGPEVVVVPGLSAAMACASLLGAPLGHDFAVISLSDLLTPWEAIERRLLAAAGADFVVALYNPRSERRPWQFPRARDLLLRFLPPETPAGLVRNAYRPGQSVEVTTLGRMADRPVDMLTTVIVGNSQTLRLGGRIVTPRGYRVGPETPGP